MSKLGIFKLYNDVEDVSYGTEQSSCFDLRAYLRDSAKLFNTKNEEYIVEGYERVVLRPGCRALMPTGMIFDIPKGYSIRIHPRSGLAVKHGITLINGEGIVDSDYVNQIFVALHNTSTNPYAIAHGDRIAQAEIIEEVQCTFEYLTFAPGVKTDRTGGFGHTGTA